MDSKKKAKLEAAGWKVGDASDFLELTPDEIEFVELKLALSRYLRRLREGRGWTQEEVAKALGSSQSRVAKMEAADVSVTVDLLVRALLLGGSRKDVGRVIEGQS